VIILTVSVLLANPNVNVILNPNRVAVNSSLANSSPSQLGRKYNMYAIGTSTVHHGSTVAGPELEIPQNFASCVSVRAGKARF